MLRWIEGVKETITRSAEPPVTHPSLPEPRERAIETARSSATQKQFSLKELLSDDEFDTESVSLFTSICRKPDVWTCANPPRVIHFLQSTLQGYMQRLTSANKRLIELNLAIQTQAVTANELGYKIILEQRIEFLQQSVRDYEDCLYERILALQAGEIDSFLEFKFKKSSHEQIKSFLNAIYICHMPAQLQELTLKQLADMVEDHGRAGINAAAGGELCKIITIEVLRRFDAGLIPIHDANLKRIQGYFTENIDELRMQLETGICKTLTDMVDKAQLTPTDSELCTLAKRLKSRDIPGHNKLYAAIRDALLFKISSNQIGVFSAELKAMFTFFENTPDNLIPLAKVTCAEVINQLQTLKVQEDAPEMMAFMELIRRIDSSSFIKLEEAVVTCVNTKVDAFKRLYRLLFKIISDPTKKDFMTDKYDSSGQELIKQIQKCEDDSPVRFIWSLACRFYSNISPHNVPLFKEMYKARFKFSYLKQAKLNGHRFFADTDGFRAEVDNLNAATIREFAALDDSTCRGAIYQGLK